MVMMVVMMTTVTRMTATMMTMMMMMMMMVMTMMVMMVVVMMMVMVVVMMRMILMTGMIFFPMLTMTKIMVEIRKWIRRTHDHRSTCQHSSPLQPFSQLLPGVSPSSDDWRKALSLVVPAVVVLRITTPRAFDTESASAGYATGFVVDKARGIILTNRHVVKSGLPPPLYRTTSILYKNTNRGVLRFTYIHPYLFVSTLFSCSYKSMSSYIYYI